MKLRILAPIAAAAMLAVPAFASTTPAANTSARAAAATTAKPKPAKHRRMVRRTARQRAAQPAK